METKMHITEEYRHLFSGLIEYASHLVDVALQEHREIAIWGYWKCGKFIRHLIEDCDGRTKVSYIIDEKLENFSETPVIYRSTVLNYISSSDILLLATIRNVSEIKKKVEEYGYQEGENFFDIYSDIGESYIAYLQKKNKVLDFGNLLEQDEELYGSENVEHTPFSFSAADKVFSEIVGLDEKLSFFDFGCGKGTALLYAHMYGIRRLGGVELVKKVYDSVMGNLRELGIEADIIHGNAMECNIDEYNCFFLYNPFRGKTFEKVIGRIEESFQRIPRTIYLIYGNPFEHQAVVRNGVFSLYRQLVVDLYDPLLNIYRIVK